MKKAIFFAGVMGVILSGGAAHATFPEDTASYPTYQSAEQTVGSETFAAGSLIDANIKLATTKYVDTKADTANGAVQTLSNTATADNATVTANSNSISTMTSGRQVTPNDVCGTLANDEIACGYIVPLGTTTTTNDANKHDRTKYQWVKIIATAETVTAENGSSGT